METSAWKVMWREIKHDKLALIGLILFSVIVSAVYIWAPFIDSDIMMNVDLRNRNLPPQPSHLLGTDPAGRDMLGQLILSARNSFNIAFIVTAAGAVIGVFLGLVSGFYGGQADNVMMRFLDFYTMIPPLMLVIVVGAVFSPLSMVNFTLVLIAIWAWQSTTRLIRSVTLRQGTLDYVSASKTLGTPNFVIIFREVLPNLISIITANFTLNMAMNMGIEVGLTFLGLGLPFGIPSLGRLVAFAANPTEMVLRPWLWLPAALLITIMMLCINFVGQALNRAADAKKRMV